MQNELLILCATAASIGFVHTLMGPDHYLPFIVMAKARNWSTARTALITFLCGIGHVGSSVVLGLIGVACGIAVFRLESIESARGDIAAWLLIIFGFAYTIYGVHRAIRGKPHTHSHNHACGEKHDHTHNHHGEHTHVHASSGENMTPWILFTIFVFGPCEPLIPIIMYPAAKHNTAAVITVAAIFSLVTIATMMTIVSLSTAGLSRLNFHRFEKYSHAIAGLSLLLCGGAIKLLGL
jgi:nickel/cobalt transporter (NicO) family protein